jgi:hypothetical protein
MFLNSWVSTHIAWYSTKPLNIQNSTGTQFSREAQIGPQLFEYEKTFRIQVLYGDAILTFRPLARRASRRPGTPIEQKMDAFGRPNSGEKGKLFSMISLSLIYLKQNSFNSHYYYTLILHFDQFDGVPD